MKSALNIMALSVLVAVMFTGCASTSRNDDALYGLEKRNSIIQVRINKLNDEVEMLGESVRKLNELASRKETPARAEPSVQPEKAREIGRRIEALSRRLDAIAPETADASAAGSTVMADASKPAKDDRLRVRVLSRDGSTEKPQAALRILREKGYYVPDVERASGRHMYDADVVFYADGMLNAASEVAEALDLRASIRRIDWKTDYHVVVFVGK